MGIFGLLLYTGVAHAQGYDGYVGFESAANYAGTCASTGSLNGHAVPRCTNGVDGSFDVPAPYLLSAAGTGANISIKSIAFTNNGSIATGNHCFRASFVSLTDNADIASITYGTPTALVTKDVSTCTTGTTPMCNTTTTAAVQSKDLGTGSDCATTACNNTRLIIHVEYCDVTASGTCATACTSEAAGTVDAVGMAYSVQ